LNIWYAFSHNSNYYIWWLHTFSLYVYFCQLNKFNLHLNANAVKTLSVVLPPALVFLTLLMIPMCCRLPCVGGYYILNLHGTATNPTMISYNGQ
jgi:hypothetical protein